MCGQETVYEIDRDTDYWYILAEGMGFIGAKGVALIKGLYDVWNPAETSHFAVFVQQVIKENRGH